MDVEEESEWNEEGARLEGRERERDETVRKEGKYWLCCYFGNRGGWFPPNLRSVRCIEVPVHLTIGGRYPVLGWSVGATAYVVVFDTYLLADGD